MIRLFVDLLFHCVSLCFTEPPVSNTGSSTYRGSIVMYSFVYASVPTGAFFKLLLYKLTSD